MKRKLVLMLCITMLAGILHSGNWEVKASETHGSNVNGKVLEKIATAVKKKIAIPKDLTSFTYDYYNEKDTMDVNWYLSWNSKTMDKGIHIICDANGNIVEYYHFSNMEDRVINPKYLKSELKSTGNAFLKKVAPKIYSKLKYISSSYNGVYSGTYTYVYHRIENGIMMPDNYAIIEINAETKEVTSLQIKWNYDVTIPEPNTNVTKEKAIEKVKDNMEMVLSYRPSYKNGENSNVKAYLVYSPSKSYISIDGKTGEVYTSKEVTYSNTEDGNKEESAEDSNVGDGGTTLTEEEIKKISELKNVISEEKAIKAVRDNKYLLIRDSWNIETVGLYRVTYNSEAVDYVWRITFVEGRDVDNSSSNSNWRFAEASVDAITGKIISFYAGGQRYYEFSDNQDIVTNLVYNQEQGQEIFEKFAKEQIPDLFMNAIPTKNDEISMGIENLVDGGYQYYYSRVNNKIPYHYNSIAGEVDGETGKIYSFSYNWDKNITFESPKKAMSPEKAFTYYIGKEGFNLIYEVNTTMEEETGVRKAEVRLVYSTDINRLAMSPFTGEQLDWNGEPYSGEKNYVYRDISNEKAKRAILLLADMNIGFEGGKFQPEKVITKGELEEFLESAGYSRKVLSAKASKEKSTRLYVIKRLITCAGLKDVAKINNIYKVNFADKNKISDKNKGYVALAQGFGIVDSGKKVKLRPSEHATRAEVAQMLVELFEVKF